MTKERLELIVAMGKNNVIGKDNALIWRLKEDMEHFIALTKNKTVVMGSKTYESIGKPLPKRKNVILTSNPEKYESESLLFSNSVEEILKLSEKEKIIIIGGTSVYKQFIPHCDDLYITEIDHDFDGDSYFPVLDKTIWEKVDFETGTLSGVIHEEKNPDGLKYIFSHYKKK